jgi:hypothetical protein
MDGIQAFNPIFAYIKLAIARAFTHSFQSHLLSGYYLGLRPVSFYLGSKASIGRVESRERDGCAHPTRDS